MSATGAAPASWPVRELRAALAALTFLTRLPIGNRITLDGADVARSGSAFPLVGAGVGAAVGGVAVGLQRPLSPLLGAALAVCGGTLLTGALHLDALSDTADGLGARSRERALEVMRDSTIGAFGASAIGLDLLIKVVALASIARDGRAVLYVLAAGALSRTVPVVLAAWLPYARAEAGTGSALTRGSAARTSAATLVAVAAAVATLALDGAILAASAAALTALFVMAYRRWLDGVTGDALGASLELTETALLVLAVALIGGR